MEYASKKDLLMKQTIAKYFTDVSATQEVDLLNTNSNALIILFGIRAFWLVITHIQYVENAMLLNLVYLPQLKAVRVPINQANGSKQVQTTINQV